MRELRGGKARASSSVLPAESELSDSRGNAPTGPSVLFAHARVFDGFSESCPEGMFVHVEGGLIREVSERQLEIRNAVIVDVAGRTLMPGLIDAHVHAYFCDVDWHKTDRVGEAYRTAHAI